VGQLRAVGEDLQSSRNVKTAWYAAALEVSAALPLSNRLRLFVGLGTAAPLSHWDYVLNHGAQAVFRTGSLSPRVEIGMEAALQ